RCIKKTFAHFVAFADWTSNEAFRAYFVMDGIYIRTLSNRTHTLLAEASQAGVLASDKRFAKFIAETFGLDRPFEHVAIDASRYRFEIWRDDRLAGTVGKGPNRVVMSFVTAAELDLCQHLLTQR